MAGSKLSKKLTKLIKVVDKLLADGNKVMEALKELKEDGQNQDKK